MSKSNKIVLIVMISFIILGLSYWFIYRPYAIKKYCLNRIKGIEQNERKKEFTVDQFNDIYSYCLKKKAL